MTQHVTVDYQIRSCY